MQTKISLRIGRIQPTQLPKPPFVVLIERNFQQSKINATYKFPRASQDVDSDEDLELKALSVCNLAAQNLTKHMPQNIRQPTKRAVRITSMKGRELNLSMQRLKTDINEETLKNSKLPNLPSGKKQLHPLTSAHVRSISQTTFK